MTRCLSYLGIMEWTAKVTMVVMVTLKSQPVYGFIRRVHHYLPGIHQRQISHTKRFPESRLRTVPCNRLISCRRSRFFSGFPSLLTTSERLSQSCSGGTARAVITLKRLASTRVKCIHTSTHTGIVPQAVSSTACGEPWRPLGLVSTAASQKKDRKPRFIIIVWRLRHVALSGRDLTPCSW